MTEVPEHLLSRSREARQRLTGEGGGDGGDAASDAASDAGEGASEAVEAAVVPAAPAAPSEVVPAEPPPPEPVAPYVEAARRRKRVPYWIVPVLLFIPIWSIYYVGLLETPPAEEGGLLIEGGEYYETKGCAGCHGGGGGGGTGRQLNDGEVLLTFPSLEDEARFDGLAHHISWVVNGTGGTLARGDVSYGDPDRPGGQRLTGDFGNMGGGESLSIEELVAVVHYERVTHGGLTGDAAEVELEVLEEFVNEAEESGLVWSGQSPDEIAELLSTARSAVGTGGEAASE